MWRNKHCLIRRRLDEKKLLVPEHYDSQPDPATDAEYSVAEFKNTQLLSWLCNKLRRTCNSLSQNKTWKSLEWDSTYSQHQPWCKQAPVNSHVFLLKLQMLFGLHPSASKPAAGFSWQLFNLHNSQQNAFSLSLILKGYTQKASEMSFGVNGF